MSNPIQESREEHLDPFDSRFSTLCLNSSSAVDGSAGHHHHHHPPPLCSSCGRRPPRSAATPLKRRSPSAFQNPSVAAKKLFLDHQQPIPSSSSPLRRCVSLPIEPHHFSPPSPANPPPPLRRTVSDPNPIPDETPFQISTPIDSVKEDSPDSKRLKKFKNRLKEMNQWWNELMTMSEDEKTDAQVENHTEKAMNFQKIGCCKDGENDEETVGVERIGEAMELHLKCPCGKAFDIVFSGNNCFYKLL